MAEPALAFLTLGAVHVFYSGFTQNPSSAPQLQGRIMDGRGRPIEGAIVSLRSHTHEQPLVTLSLPDGSYSFRGLQLGIDYELSAEHEGLASRTRPLRVSDPTERVTIDLTVAPRIEFEDIAPRAGLNFTVRNGASGHFYQPEIMIAGVAALDYNNDGCMDIYFINGASFPEMKKTGPEYRNRLFRNNCDLTFSDVTERAGVGGQGYGMGVATADYDNDGYPDIFIAGLHGNTLYHNRRDGTFEDVTTKAGLVDSLSPERWGISAGWFDYDNDGWLDLFVSNYVKWDIASEFVCTAQTKPYYCHPRVYQGQASQLFHNNRDGTFTDVSRDSRISASVGKGMGVVFGDFNCDGFIDVFVANDSVPNFLFQNLGNGRFKEVALQVGVAYAMNGNAVAGMGADFRDFDNDGLEDLVVSAMYFDTFPLYRNQSKPRFFLDETISSGLANATRNLTGWSIGLYDFDNDSNKDLFVATSHFPGSEPYAGSDAAMPNHVFRGLGNRAFQDVSRLAGDSFQIPALYHGAAFADFDNDGRVDVVVTAQNSPARLYRNISAHAGHWLAVRLIGSESNRDGLGATVRITLPNGTREYNRATTSVGYASSSEPLVRFGLGPYDRVSEIKVRWPSGRMMALRQVAADQLIHIREK